MTVYFKVFSWLKTATTVPHNMTSHPSCLLFFVRRNVYYLKAWRTQQQATDLWWLPGCYLFLKRLSWLSQQTTQIMQSLLILEVWGLETSCCMRIPGNTFGHLDFCRHINVHCCQSRGPLLVKFTNCHLSSNLTGIQIATISFCFWIFQFYLSLGVKDSTQKKALSWH